MKIHFKRQERGSQLQHSLIILEFKDDVAKRNALLKLKEELLYRESENSSYIYKLV